jgi:hydrogenase expression/formation protein HypC
MCLAVPALVIERIEADLAIIDAGGVRMRVSLALVPEAALGDYVIVHAGFAISRLDPEEAAQTLALFAQIPDEAPRSGAPAGIAERLTT